MKEHDAPYLLAKSRFVAEIDEDSCVACGICSEERCPMDAIVEDDDVYRVSEKRCIGCGVCAITCPTDAIMLVPRPESAMDGISGDMAQWEQERSAARGL